LPGAGWNPVDRSRINIQVGTGTGMRNIEVNRIMIQRGLDRQLVLYWYQAHGRIVASEYWGKIYTVVDTIRLNRTDAALVRVMIPISGSGAQAEHSVERAAVQFVQSLFPLLPRYLPE
jgi:EpsI family protein